MVWPFKRTTETFETVSFTDAYVNALLSAAGVETSVDAFTTAQAEFAAGLWQRTLASAQVEPSYLSELITPDVLGCIGRQLIIQGECFGVVDDMMIALASESEVYGGVMRSSWRFRLTLDGPTMSQTRTVPWADVLMFQWSSDPRRPWRGVGPLQRANISAALLARIEQRLSQEAGATSAYLLPVPQTDNVTLEKLPSDIKAAKGGAVLVKATKNWAFEEGRQGAGVAREYQQQRLGAAIPESNITLRSKAGVDVVSACGIPAAMLTADADGTASRAAVARFLDFSVDPLASTLSAEFSRKLGVSVMLSFEHLRRADTVLTMARSVAQLVASGMSIQDAVDTVGLESG